MSEAPTQQGEQTLPFHIVSDISEAHIEQLVAYTNRNIANGISPGELDGDDHRFASREQFDTWRAKGRDIYTAVDEHGDLLGIYWVGRRQPPSASETHYLDSIDPTQYDVTTAIRLYETDDGNSLRGKGFAGVFANACLNDWGRTHGQGIVHIWTATDPRNAAAIKSQERRGAKIVSDPFASNGTMQVVLLRDHVVDAGSEPVRQL